MSAHNHQDFKSFFLERFHTGDLVVFPTGMGSELLECDEALNPDRVRSSLWASELLLTTEGHDLIRGVHRNAIRFSGVDVITSNTWTRPTAFKDIPSIGDKWQESAHEALSRGIEIAVEIKNEVLADADNSRDIYVGGSFGPLGNSHEFHADAMLTRQDYRRHVETANILVKAAPDDVDFLIPETACHFQEAWFMARAASQTGKPFILGLTPGEDGQLRDGSSLVEAAHKISALNGFTAIAINCVPPEYIEKALRNLRGGNNPYDGPLVVYPNGFGLPNDNGGWCHDHRAETVTRFADAALDWAARWNVTGIGGCCGTTSHSYGRHLGKSLREERQKRSLATYDVGG